jgi:hypothetical protein
MPCSVRLNDCCRREQTSPTMTYFQFNGAPGEHPGPEGFVTLVNPHLDGFFDRSRRRSTDCGPRWSKDAHQPRAHHRRSGTASFDFPHGALQSCRGALPRDTQRSP